MHIYTYNIRTWIHTHMYIPVCVCDKILFSRPFICVERGIERRGEDILTSHNIQKTQVLDKI